MEPLMVPHTTPPLLDSHTTTLQYSTVASVMLRVMLNTTTTIMLHHTLTTTATHTPTTTHTPTESEMLPDTTIKLLRRILRHQKMIYFFNFFIFGPFVTNQ